MTPAETIAAVYINHFAARSDEYAFWRGDHWERSFRPLTPQAVLDAFGAKVGLSGYMLTPQSMTHVCAVDFDTEDGWDLARRLRDTMDFLGAFAYIAPSRRGAHLWSVLDRPIPARTVRRALRGFMGIALIDADNPKIELRPSHDEIRPDGFGSPIRLPTMHHPKTGKRYPLCGPDDQPLGTSLADILIRLEWADHRAFEQMAEKTPGPLDDSYRPPKAKWPEGAHESACELLTTLWGAQRAIPGRSVRCPAHDDQVASLSILMDDERVICKSPSCILNNGEKGRGTNELRRMAPGA